MSACMRSGAMRAQHRARFDADDIPSKTVVQGQDAYEYKGDHRDGPTSYYRSLTSKGRRRGDVLEAAAAAVGDDRLTTRPVDWELQRRVCTASRLLGPVSFHLVCSLVRS